ncbi:MAG: helix-turn-helix domain-containing protein [Rhodobacteraceae bacterium]|nr:helix-turn-helix domain-containing protein [Paracoccaceae bacterium]
MLMSADSKEADVRFHSGLGIDGAVGLALRHHRIAAGQAIRELGKIAGISSAMISRIENGQVSPSLATLEALANALSVPVISLFQHTIQRAEVSFVKAGEGLSVTSFAADHVHASMVLAQFTNNSINFSAKRITFESHNNGNHPQSFANGYVLLTVTSGTCVYLCGGQAFELSVGDTLCFDAQLRHGVYIVTSKSVSLIVVTACPA